ncbi:MalY/PatB family protein [Corynebacterium halotolerans]|uniref:MalY/PatB family protein n=1 Tax=Corynebacterium halotolerans TaxID=225326 RepID=UPI003CE6C48B
MQIPSLDVLRNRQTRKWTVYDDDVIPLWIAESDFATAEPVHAAIQDAVDREAFGYSPAGDELQHALSDFYADRFGWRPDPARIFAVPDVVRGLMLSVKYLTRPGSSVIVPTPAYMPFLDLPEAAGREMVTVDSYNGLDLAEVEREFAGGAGSLVLCSPHNPLGYTYTEDFLHELVALADKYDARILADEIHAPLQYEGTHLPVANISELAARVCITVTATSKAWNIAGLKCAQVIFSNDDDVDAWQQLNGVIKDGVGTLGVFAATACYSEGREFLDQQVAYLRDNRDWLVENLPARVPGLQVSNPVATYLMWLDFSGTALPEEYKDRPATWLRQHAKVAMNEGVTFGQGGKGCARLNFATSRELLEEAVDRIATAIGQAEDAG